MKNNLLLIFLSLSLFHYSCDKESIMECEGIEIIEGSAEMNGGKQRLRFAQAIQGGFGIDTYEFYIGTISNDCSQESVCRFFLSLPTDAPLEGVFPLLPTTIFTPNMVTSFSFQLNTLDPPNVAIHAAVDGELSVMPRTNGETAIDLKVNLDNAEAFTLKMVYDF